MERNSHVAETFRPLLNLLSAPLSASSSALPLLPDGSSGADAEEGTYEPIQLGRFEDIDRLAGITAADFGETTPETEATAVRMRTWRSNPDLPPLGAHVKMPAGPYEVIR